MHQAINQIFILLIGISLILAGIIALISLIVAIIQKKHSKLAKAFYLFLGIGLIVVGGNMSLNFFTKEKPPTVEAQLLESAKEKNKNLPVMINAETRADSVSVAGRIVSLNFTLIDYLIDPLTKDKVKETLTSQIMSIQCGSEKMKKHYEHGISYHYNYYGKEGGLLTTIIISTETCSGKGT